MSVTTASVDHDLPEAALSIAEVAGQAGVSTNTVRFYERHSVVQSRRTSTNVRRFTIDAVCRVKLARAAQRVGLTLKESAAILAEIPPMCPDMEKWIEATQRLVAAGHERIGELEAAVDEFRTVDFLRA